MKRLLKVLLVLVMTCVMSACSTSEGTKEVTLVGEYNGTYYEISFEAEGDKVIKQTQSSTMDLSGVDEATLEAYEEIIAEYADLYEEYEFSEYSASIENYTLKETIVLDLSKTEYIQEMIESGLLPLEDEDVEYISLSETVESLESSMGLTQK